MATFKEALTTSLTNFAKSIAKTYPKTANIVDNLLSTDSTLPLSAKQGNVLQTEIDTLNSNYIDASVDTTIPVEESKIKTIYTATEKCEVIVSALHFWTYVQPASLMVKKGASSVSETVGAWAVRNTEKIDNAISISGAFILAENETLDLYASAVAEGSNFLSVKLIVRKLDI